MTTTRSIGTRSATKRHGARQSWLVVTAVLLLTPACAASSDDDTPQPTHTTSPGVADDTSEPTPGSDTDPTATETETPMADHTPITITIGDTVLDGRLWNNPTANDLIAQLPLTLDFRDFNDVEKIARLPQALMMNGVPEGDNPEPQDIGYYAPTGDLVFYYDDVGYFDGIVRLGTFDSDMEPIRRQTSGFTATIELLD
jgi:hypothetical protein